MLSTLRAAVAFERRPVHTVTLGASRAELFQLHALVAGRIHVVASQRLATDILQNGRDLYLTGRANRRMLPVLPENTLLTLDGEHHRQRRRQLAQLFSGERFTQTAAALAKLIATELDTWPIGQPIAVLPRLRALTFRVAVRLVLGPQDERAVRSLERQLAAAVRPYGLLAGYERLSALGPLAPEAFAARQRARFAQCLGDVAEASILEMSADEVLALLLAGRDTTASALAWALLELARHPQVADELGAQPSDDPGHAGWLDAVIHEALRLHPPLIDIVRSPLQPVTLAGQTLGAGELLMICPALIGRSDAYESPHLFMPHRFLGQRPDPRHWVPFGGGPRRCIGAPLAMLELREVLKAVTRRFTLSAVRGPIEAERLYGTAVVPAAGAALLLSPRAGH